MLGIANHPTMAELAKEVLDQAPDKFALVGLSMGGMVAMEVMAQQPERVSHLALIDTTHVEDLEPVKEIRDAQIAMLNEDQDKLTEIMTQILPVYYGKSTPAGSLDEVCLAMAKDLGVQTFINQSIALRDRPDYESVLTKVTCPSLIMCGSDDQLCSVESQEAMANMIPGAKLEIIENCGHISTIETPDPVNRALDELLAR